MKNVSKEDSNRMKNGCEKIWGSEKSTKNGEKDKGMKKRVREEEKREERERERESHNKEGVWKIEEKTLENWNDGGVEKKTEVERGMNFKSTKYERLAESKSKRERWEKGEGDIIEGGKERERDWEREGGGERKKVIGRKRKKRIKKRVCKKKQNNARTRKEKKSLLM